MCDGILTKFRLIQALISVLIVCKNEEDPLKIERTRVTVSIHCEPEMSEIDCIGRIKSFWPKFVRGW